jgi:exosortase
MIVELWSDPNSSHGLLIPPVVALLIWKRRARLAEIPKAPSKAGLLLAIVGAILLPFAVGSGVRAGPPISLLLVLGGLAWHIWGGGIMREFLFHYLFLFFAVPVPGLLVETLTFHLQLASAKMAALMIGLLGLPVVREGVEIQMQDYTFAVGAPCSGMRSMVALLALGALCAFLLKGGLLKRIALFMTVPPLALIGNAVRILCILLIARRWGEEAAKGFYHNFSGLIVFLMTFLLLLAMARLLGMKQMREEV